jgi:hypothetical protein
MTPALMQWYIRATNTGMWSYHETFINNINGFNRVWQLSGHCWPSVIRRESALSSQVHLSASSRPLFDTLLSVGLSQIRSRPVLKFLSFFFYYVCRAGFAAPRIRGDSKILLLPLCVYIHPHTYSYHVSSLPSMHTSIHIWNMCTLHVSSLPQLLLCTCIQTPIQPSIHI